MRRGGSSEIKCPICEGICRSVFVGRSNLFIHEKCKDCGHICVANPPDELELSQVYLKDLCLGRPSPQTVINRLKESKEKLFLRTEVFRHQRQAHGPLNILDVGCGLGDISFYLHKYLSCKITLLDFVKPILYSKFKCPHAYIKGGAEQIGKLNDQFDIVIFSHVLEHLVDPVSALLKASGKLRPRGKIIVFIPNQSGLYGYLGRYNPYLIPPFHLHHFTMTSLRIALKNAGLVGKLSTTSEMNSDGKKIASLKHAFHMTFNALFAPLADSLKIGLHLTCVARRT